MGYHLKHVRAFIKIHHCKENLVGKRAGVAPGIRKDLVFLICLPIYTVKEEQPMNQSQ